MDSHMWRRSLSLIAMACFADFSAKAAQPPASAASAHYLFAWTGDMGLEGNDFLAVIDADPASSTYGALLTTMVTDQKTARIHHTEYVMPASGMLFANGRLRRPG